MRKILLLFLPLLMAVSATAQLSGVYTINGNASANADYTSFSAAVSALSAGVSGPVVFEVAPGTYEEYVTVSHVSGASLSNRVVFRGMGTDNQQVVVTSNAGYTDNSTLKFNGADFVTFENMTITTSSANNAVLLRFNGDVDSNRFENVRFVGVEVALSSSDNNKNLVHMNSAAGAFCDGNEFVDCQFVNGCIALYLQGLNMSQFNTGVLVENCTFTNQQFKSVYLTFYNDAVVRGNIIINANDFKTDYNAIDAFQCFNDCLFENNVINVTRATSYTTVFRLRPCVGDSTHHVIVRNNMVNLHSNASSSSYCFNISNNNSAYIDFAHNTLKCSGTGNNGNIYLQNNGEHLSFYNNLLVNETEGYVFRFVTNSLTERYSDFNRISYNGANFARRGTVDYVTLQDWTDSTGLDANSALCTPHFVGAQDLHITTGDSLMVAHPLDYVAEDIDGQLRSATPCAGADEFLVNANLPPVVANPINDVTFDSFPALLNVDVSQVFDDPDDDNDSIMVSVLSSSNPNLVSAVLTGDTLMLVRLASTGGTSVVTLQAVSHGDTILTSFSVVCVAQDLPPVVVSPLAPIVFTAFPQTLSFDLDGVFDDPDNNNLFMMYDAEAVLDEVTAYVDDEDNLVVVRNSANAFMDTVIVTATSHGKMVEMRVPVSGSQVVLNVGVADFEDVTLSSQGYWIPAQEDDYNNMISGGWLFSNFYSSYFWGGFTASNRTDTNQTGMSAQYTAITAGGQNGSAQYAVAYTMGVPTVVSAADGQTHTVTGCYVTNNVWAYQDMRDGGYGYAPFGGSNGTAPDYFVLHAVGKDLNGSVIDTLHFYLADYRFANSNDDYIVNTWEWFDLSPLGPVASISFSLESTVGNQSGMLTPAYFCLDNFNGVAPDQPHVDLPPYVVNPVEDLVSNEYPDSLAVNLLGVVTDDDNSVDSIVYTLLANSNEAAVDAQISGNMLQIIRLMEEEGTATLTVRATSGDLYVDFDVRVILNPVVGLKEFDIEATLWPNPSNGQITISVANASGFAYSVINAVGQCVVDGRSYSEREQLNLAGFGKGVYFITITVDEKFMSRKVIVR